jgi:type III secretory pathway lipoprotein EscJ
MRGVLRVVATATSEAEAEMIVARLTEAGIHALQKPNSGIGGMQIGGGVGGREVYVEEPDAERALELLGTQEFSDEELAALSEQAYEENTRAVRPPDAG